MSELAGRVGVVTGGGGAIGAVAAETLADLGADVVICGRDLTRLEHAAAARPGRIHPFTIDVSDEAAWPALQAELLRRFGRPVAALVTAAGINHRERFVSSTREHWEAMWRTNVTGTMLPARALLPGMIEEGFGRIVLVSSVGARIGLADRAAYTATKGAVEAFGRSLAAEVGAAGVTVNCVAPGAMPTELTRRWLDERDDVRDEILSRVPIGRLGDPSELDGAFRFLLESGYSQASTVVVDGGWTAV
jgi:2-hydroxycyclohexanecarboxyl-CoA dehydrogenase